MTKCDNSQCIISTLIYFDIFHYPLTLEELHAYSDTEMSLAEFKDELQNLVNEEKVYQFASFYCLNNNPELVKKRMTCNQRAKEQLPIAQKYSRILSRIPFIKCICLSGSISKGVMHENSDIDYFVITEAGKVWITKFLVILYRVIFLFNKTDFFCVNYFIDEEYLEIEEQNRFTATEVVTMIPTMGYDLYKKFRNNNTWTKIYFPDYPDRNRDLVEERPASKSIKSKLLRLLFDNSFGKFIGNLFMRVSWARHKRKFSSTMTDEWLNIAFKTNPKVSKSHGPNFQKVVAEQLRKRISDFEKKHDYEFQNFTF